MIYIYANKNYNYGLVLCINIFVRIVMETKNKRKKLSKRFEEKCLGIFHKENEIIRFSNKGYVQFLRKQDKVFLCAWLFFELFLDWFKKYWRNIKGDSKIFRITLWNMVCGKKDHYDWKVMHGITKWVGVCKKY